MRNKKSLTRTSAPTTLVALALGLILAGCGSDGTLAPSHAPQKNTDPVLTNPAGTGGGFDTMGDEEFGLEIPIKDDPRGGGDIPLGPGSKMAQFDVDPIFGGTYSAGRIVVEIPAGAINEVIKLKIHDHTIGNMAVSGDLLPHGYQFNEPVTLTFSLTGTVAEDWDDATIFWLNEETNQWVNIGGTRDLEANTLWVELDHFSSYGVGRAGWFKKAVNPIDSGSDNDSREGDPSRQP